jgi:glycogen operon protein
MDGDDWADPNARAIAIYLDGSDDPDRAADGTLLIDDDFVVLVNSWWEPLEFVLPATRPQAAWRVEIDTYDPEARDGTAATGRHAGDSITVGPRSVVVLLSPRPQAG